MQNQTDQQTLSATTQPERLYTEKELTEAGYGSRSKLATDRMRGQGIPFVYVGTAVRYRESDILKWLEANSAKHALQWSTARRQSTVVKGAH